MQINRFIRYTGIRLLQTKATPPIFFYRLTCLWGLFLLLPFNTFANNGFAIMRQYAPENVWGVLIFCVGIRLRMAQQSRNTRRIRDGLFGALIIWLFISIMIAAANPQGTGIITYPFFTFYIAREYLIYSVRYSVLKQEIDDVTD